MIKEKTKFTRERKKKQPNTYIEKRLLTGFPQALYSTGQMNRNAFPQIDTIRPLSTTAITQLGCVGCVVDLAGAGVSVNTLRLV